MDLILWRHAEAEDSQPDLARVLTPKGEKQARRVAEWLHTRLPASARILASPARRTQQTAGALADLADRKFKTLDALAPGASVEALLAAAGWPAGRTPVVVVGHQPTLGLAIALILGGRLEDCAVRKGSAWWLSSRQRDGEDQAYVRAVVTPDLA